MAYKRFFDPPKSWRVGQPDPEKSIDRRDGSVYYFHDDEIILAVNVALVTGRPLFLQGPSGSGKSSLARTVARQMRRRYYERVISSRTVVRDLQWSFDALRRLQDAQAIRSAARKSLAVTDYIEPGVLWWAFDPVSASKMPYATDPTIIDFEPKPATPEELRQIPAVVLLDEIDKADPDLPNDLLVPLGSLRFRVEGLSGDDVVAGGGERDPADIRSPLIVITTNKERDMPPAFLRRCVILDLKAPLRNDLLEIARLHLGDERMAKVAPITAQLLPEGSTPLLSTAELLDALHAAAQLESDLDSWPGIAALTIRKPKESVP